MPPYIKFLFMCHNYITFVECCQLNYTSNDNLLSLKAGYNITGVIFGISERIKELRENAGYSQAELARRLDVTRSSVNAWEMGLSAPTIQYVVAIAKLFHVSSDYLLGIKNESTVVLDEYSLEEIKLVYDLLKYFDSKK